MTGLRFHSEIYAAGLVCDVVVPAEASSAGVLLWHGIGVAERLVVRRLAVELASAGCVVVVPDLVPKIASNGLTESFAYAGRVFDDQGVAATSRTLAGWSFGATAAMRWVTADRAPTWKIVSLAGRLAGSAVGNGEGMPLQSIV